MFDAQQTHEPVPGVRLIQGDVLAELARMPPESVQCCITSPPYWGLRSYGVPPSVWGGEAGCEHEWGEYQRPGQSGGTASAKVQTKGKANFQAFGAQQQAFCSRCGAWRGCYGLEPTPALYVEHSVAVFREVRRVLRPDGTLWLNLGDSYASSGGYAGDGCPSNAAGSISSGMGQRTCPRRPRASGLKHKDLCEIPSDVVRALRADGWWLRSRIPWLKRNPMPESTTDRPASAVEYVFLMTKSARCFYDAEAVRVRASRKSQDKCPKRPSCGAKTLANRGEQGVSGSGWADADVPYRPTFRSRRNSDWFWESWQGLLSGENGEPLAFIVNPQPFKGAHFATFPPKLVEPMVKAGTSEKGCCPTCGRPWERVVEKKGGTTGKSWHDHGADALAGMSQYDPALQAGGVGNAKDANGEAYSVRTLGFRPACSCPAADPAPCAVLDPFAGSGTTLAVAAQLGRRAIGIELNPDYARMACDRIGRAVRPATHVSAAADAPLFAEVGGG